MLLLLNAMRRYVSQAIRSIILTNSIPKASSYNYSDSATQLSHYAGPWNSAIDTTVESSG